MRAVGFAGLTDRKETQRLVTDAIINSTNRNYTSYQGDDMIAQFDKEYAPGIGISVCGMFDA